MEVKKRWKLYEKEKNQNYRDLIRESLNISSDPDDESRVEN